MKKARTLKWLGLGLVVLLGSAPLAAQTWTGEGYGKTAEIARQNALEDLASQLETKVYSQTEASAIGNQNALTTSIRSQTRSTVDLPILGAIVEAPLQTKSGDFRVAANLTVATSLPLYRAKVDDLTTKIANLNKQQAGIKATKDREAVLLDLLTAVEQFEKYRTVLVLFEAKNLPEVVVSRADAANLLRQVQETLDSLDRAAAAIAKTVKLKDVYVYPPEASGSSEITPFASAFRDNLKKYVSAVDSLDRAKYALKGAYSGQKDGLDLAYSLVGLTGDDNGRILASSTARLLPQAYAGLSWEPQGSSFDKLLRDGLVVSGDFRIDVSTNRGKHDLLYRAGDEVEILVKLNAPGYFYIVSHINVDGQAFSYLLDFDPSTNQDRRFVKYISPDDANHWVSLGKFVVQAPYGVERLQLVASKADLVDALPPHGYDPASGYFRLGTDQAANVKITRGLKPKITQTNQPAVTVEGLLTITSMK